MKKVVGLISIIMLTIMFYYGDWYSFQLRGTNLTFKGHHKHETGQYIIDSDTGNIIVDAHIVDIYRTNGVIMIQRIVTLGYDCGENRSKMFIRYKDELEVVVFNIESSEIRYLNEYNFLNWLTQQNIKNPFEFKGHFNNEERFQELNSTIGCFRM